MTESLADPRITPEAKRGAHIHYIVAFCGGILGIFPIVNISRIFGSSQTVNLIECVHSIIGFDWVNFGWHALGVFLYSLATFLVTFLSHHTKLNLKIVSLAIDFLAAVVMFLLPLDLPAVFYLYPTFFAMSFQWNAFSGGYGYTSSTIFSTNNLRQFVSALTERFCNGKKEFALKAKFFGATLIGFHLGVAAAFLLWAWIGNAGFLFVALPCSFASVLIITGRCGVSPQKGVSAQRSATQGEGFPPQNAYDSSKK